jgi:lactam utilization protein B
MLKSVENLLPGSSRMADIPVLFEEETYSDREHTEDGSIVLTRKGPAIENYGQMAERVVTMVKEGKVVTHDGKEASI